MKKAILMCTCSFACPSMKDLDLGELAERIRMELPHDYAKFTAGRVKSVVLSRIFAVALVALAAQRAWILLT